MKIREIQIHFIKPHDGHIAFASAVVDDQLYIGGIGVHQMRTGDLRLVYPARKVGAQNFPYFHPIRRECGAIIERAVLAECQRLLNA